MTDDLLRKIKNEKIVVYIRSYLRREKFPCYDACIFYVETWYL